MFRGAILTTLPSLTNSLKENRSKLASLENSSAKEIENLSAEHDALLEVLERVQEHWNAQSTEAKALAKEALDLGEDLITVKEAQEILESRVKGKRQDLAVKQKSLQDLESTLDGLTNKVSKAEDTHRSVESELRDKEETLSDRRDLLESLQEDHKDLMRKLERERLGLREKYEELVSKYHAIRFLLREDFVDAPEAKILKALEGKSSISIDELKSKTSLTTYRVEKAVKLLTERGVLDFASRSGEITVKRQIQL